MYRENPLEPQVYDPAHRQRVFQAIADNFPTYFSAFADRSLTAVFSEQIKKHAQEQEVYRNYLDQLALAEFEYDVNAFKRYTKNKCPIVRRCLQSTDEVMKAYKRSFNHTTGRELLDAVRSIGRFALAYVAAFDDRAHEATAAPDEMGLEPLNEAENICAGVIGYGIQSSLLYGVYPRCFAHRSQNAVWSLYFLSGRQDFDLQDGSEFLMVHHNLGTCEQNYFYPAQLFGYYTLRIYLLLKEACQGEGVQLLDHNRYIYLSAFCDHVADMHREGINTFRWNSEHVESQPWY